MVAEKATNMQMKNEATISPREITYGSTSIAAVDAVALAAAIGGELFSSEDDGRTWSRVTRTFQEVRAVLFH